MALIDFVSPDFDSLNAGRQSDLDSASRWLDLSGTGNRWSYRGSVLFAIIASLALWVGLYYGVALLFRI